MQPRQQLLDIWRSQIAYCLRPATDQDGNSSKVWHWGGRNDSDPVGDAQQLLCLLYPAQELPELNYADPDATSDAVLDALGGLGDAVEIPTAIMRVIQDYMVKHADGDGVPSYSGGANMHRLDRSRDASAEQRSVDVTEGFALALPLCLSSLSFLGDFAATVERIGRADLIAERDATEAMVRRRLIGALTGLLRSFSVSAFDADDDNGQRLIELINVDGQPVKRIIRRFRDQTSDIIATLKDITVGSGGTAGVEAPTKLFELGWSWSVVEKAPEIDVADRATQRPGRAQDAPYLYFTVVALESITTLFSPRVLRRNLLTDEEQQLVAALQLRLDITRRYWATIASFGGGSKWPLEDVPWRTTDGLEYDYYTLLVCAVATERYGASRVGDDDLMRLGDILIELANRGRITRRALDGEETVGMHFPGVPTELVGIEKIDDGPPMVWHMVDYAPLLLKRLIHAASLLNTIGARAELLAVADQVWEHLERRRIRTGRATKLWDQPGQVFRGIDEQFTDPSWHFTIRIVESMVLAARFAGSQPARSRDLERLSHELLLEAEHVYDQELLRGSAVAGPSLAQEIQAVGTTIRHAKDVVGERPGTAFALGVRALIDLDRLIAAGRDAETGE